MLQDRQIDRALAIDVHHVRLSGETVGDLADIADGHRHIIENADRQGIESLHRGRAGVHLHVVFAVPEACGSRRYNDIGRLQGIHHINRRKALGFQSRLIKVDDDLT
jgi:hypothetical protein